MNKAMAMAALAMVSTTPLAVSAQTYRDQGRQQSYQDQQSRTYRGEDGRYYECKRSNGAVGTVAGGVGGGLLGHVLGGGTLGTLAGAGGGALLGRHFDKKHTESRNRNNGC